MQEFKLTHPNEPTKEEADFFETPPHVIEALLREYPPPPGFKIIEPAAGDGAIARMLIGRFYQVIALEIREAERDKLEWICPYMICDFLETDKFYNWQGSYVGNPPFSLAYEFAKKCVESPAVYVALLLRLSFLGSIKRAAFNNAHPPTALLIIAPRPSFTNGGNDQVDVAWFIWDKQAPNNGTTIKVVG